MAVRYKLACKDPFDIYILLSVCRANVCYVYNKAVVQM